MSKKIPDMTGKHCVVTGASTGIGKVTALELATRGASVVLVCRDRGRGEAALREIEQATGNKDLSLSLADLSSQAEVRRLAAELRGRLPALHVLVNNAGAIYTQREVTADGLERTFATNHLGYFLLTDLLLDLLKKSAPARVINVASGAHRTVSAIRFDDLQWTRGYSGLRVYGHSKLANILFTYELSRRLAGTGVTANCVHPGFVRSGFGHNSGKFFSALVHISQLFALTPEQGARGSIYLASSPDVEGVSGKYFVRSKEARSSRASLDEKAAKRLWQVSEELVARSRA